MHYWGDEWFKKEGENLYNAISYVERNLRKWGIGVCGKEKYGTYRDEYLRLWDGSLYTILFGYRCFIGSIHNYPYWLNDLVEKIHKFLYWNVDRGLGKKYFYILDNINLLHKKICTLKQSSDFSSYIVENRIKEIEEEIDEWEDKLQDYENNRYWKGMIHWMEKMGIVKRVQEFQKKMYNKVFQKALKLYPTVKEEMVVDIEGWEWVKPCKWGMVDGKEIHDKYWKKV